MLEPLVGLGLLGVVVWLLWDVDVGVPWWAIVFWIVAGMGVMLMAAFAANGGPKLVGAIAGIGVAVVALWSLGGYAGYRWLGNVWGALLGGVGTAFVTALIAVPFARVAKTKRDAARAERAAERERRRFDADIAHGANEPQGADDAPS